MLRNDETVIRGAKQRWAGSYRRLDGCGALLARFRLQKPFLARPLATGQPGRSPPLPGGPGGTRSGPQPQPTPWRRGSRSFGDVLPREIGLGTRLTFSVTLPASLHAIFSRSQKTVDWWVIPNAFSFNFSCYLVKGIVPKGTLIPYFPQTGCTTPRRGPGRDVSSRRYTESNTAFVVLGDEGSHIMYAVKPSSNW